MSDTEQDDSIEKRHRREKRELQAEITRLKHSVPKGDKKRKKEVGAQIAQLEEDLKKKQQQELDVQQTSEVTSDLAAASLGDKDQVTEDGEIQTQNQPRSGKKSKAQKRREKKEEKDKERDERIKQQEIDNLYGARHLEASTLKSILKSRNLHISQIPSDGDCLYAAINEQLQNNSIQSSTAKLRKQAADHMRDNQDDFIPFLCHTDSGEPYTEEDFYKYCDKVESTKEWGGQLEVQALSNVLNHPIEVIQAEGPSLHVGQEFNTPQLLLSYHRHAFGLGEHYNSVLPGAVTEDDENEFDASEFT